MHDHDLDLIASLADSSLEEQAEARSLVESCEECRHEYDIQTSVLGALSEVEPARLTDLERAGLHRDLWTELRGDTAKATRAIPWWYRLSYAAAGLFVVVGLVAVLSQVGGSGDSGGVETFSEVSSGLAEAPTAESANPLQGLDAGSGESSTTTAAAADAGAESTPDYRTLANETRLQQLPAANRSTGADPKEADCLQAAGLENYQLEGTVEQERTYLVAVPAGVILDSDTPVTFVDAGTCEVVHVEE